LGQLEEENARLKQIVADLTLDKQMLRDMLKKSEVSATATGCEHVADRTVTKLQAWWRRQVLHNVREDERSAHQQTSFDSCVFLPESISIQRALTDTHINVVSLATAATPDHSGGN
jgi:hypothetical protein